MTVLIHGWFELSIKLLYDVNFNILMSHYSSASQADIFGDIMVTLWWHYADVFVFDSYQALNVSSQTSERVACNLSFSLYDPANDKFDQPLFATIGKYVIMALAAWNLLREVRDSVQIVA